jgi:AraC-like DNA-binding protein
LQKRDIRPAARPARGILKSAPAAGEHLRTAPLGPLAEFIEHFWAVSWDLTGQPAREAQTLGHPSLHVVVEGSRHEVSGVQTRRFTRTLEGRGHVFGIKFRPAMFSVLIDAPASTLQDRVVPVREVLGPDAARLTRALSRANHHEARVELAERFFAPRLVDAAPELLRLRDLVERAAVDRSLLQVEQLAALAGVNRRTLERQFLRFVGVRPKWVLQRYRLHEANERLKADARVNLAALALELGYVDQSHFARDFKALVGVSPAAYASR